MKATVILCIFVTVQAVYSANVKDVKTIIEKCTKDTGFKGIPEEIKTEGASKEDKCFIKCAMEEKEVLKPDGSFNLDMAKAYAEAAKLPDDVKEKVLKVLEECVKETKPDAKDLCETAYKFYQCKKSKIGAKKN